MIKEAVKKVKDKIDLSKEEMRSVFGEIMSGAAEKSDIKDFLLFLKDKRETIDEVVAAAEIMREKALKVNVSAKDLLDTCGTGGAKVRDINISTLVAIVLTASGAKVAKHGNRSFTGKCGSADLLEEIGINIHQGPEKVADLIDKTGFGFMFAPDYHPAMKNVAGVRKELKTRTIFNILGPLSNPAGANTQILGVFDEKLTEFMAGALKGLGAKRALVVHGLEGLDEISIKGKTKVSELKNGNIETYYVSPSDFGINDGSIEDIKGGDRKHNAKIVLDILDGKKGSAREMVLINVAAALKMTGKTKDFKEGVKIAAEAIDSGRAKETLEKIKRLSNQ